MHTLKLLEQEYDFSNFDQKANSTTSTSTGKVTTLPKSAGDADAADRKSVV